VSASALVQRSLATTCAAISLLFSATTAAAENPCLEANPLTVSDVAGASWLGRVLSIDTSIGLQPAYTFAVEQVYAGGNSELQAGKTIRLLSAGCFRVVGLDVGAQYLVSTTAVPNQGGLYFSSNLAAWRINDDRASFVLMWPDKPVGAMFGSVRTLRAAVALVAPNADLPETDMMRPGTDRSGGDASGPLWLIGFALVFLAAFYVTAYSNWNRRLSS
jgi:hypothetical protein